MPPVHYGGIERIIASLVEEFRRKGHQVALVAHRDSTVDADAFFPWCSENPTHLAGAWHLRKAASAFRPDVVHSFSRLVFLSGLAAAATPKIMSYQRATGGLNIRLMRHAMRHLSFTGCSEFICQQGRRAGGCWTPIPNFVDLNKFTFVPHVSSDAPLVFLSRVEEIKGPHRAIHIAKQSGRRLIIAGNRPEGPEHEAFWNREIAPHLNGEQIEYVGPVNDAQKNELLGQAAALCVPIQWDEPFGIVFIEALACGTPVIACPRGALPEIIRPRVDGILISSPRDEKTAMNTISSLSRHACRCRVEEAFSLPVVADQYLAHYRQTLS